MKFELNNDEILEIIGKVKGCKVDVKSTIEKTISSHYMHDDFFVEIIGEGTIYDLRTFDGFDLELLSDEFFEFIDSKLEDGIYISLAYANPENAGNDKVYEFEVENIDNDYCEISGISTWKDSADLLVREDRGLDIGDLESDFGIELYKKGDLMDVTFSWRGRKCWGPGCPIEICSIEDELHQPLNHLVIKMMHDAIIFEE